jgi:hypothetical protein
MERCSCCTARLGAAMQCPRCRADLSKVAGAEQSARFWLSEAIDRWHADQTEQSLRALEFSLRLHKSDLAVAFRDFAIHRNCMIVLELLAQHQWLPAMQHLYKVRSLLPHSRLLQRLQSFVGYLSAKQQPLNVRPEPDAAAEDQPLQNAG